MAVEYKLLMFNNLCSLQCFAYLHPKEMSSANTRLFYGVGQDTQTEKTESAYNLKVAHIVFFRHKKIAVIRY